MTRPKPAALIADDDQHFRLALRAILIDQLGISEVVETGTLIEATETILANETVKFAFLDLNMPGGDPFVGIRATRTAFPELRVTVTSTSSDRYDVLRALEAGAHGFVPKGESAQELGMAIRRITEGAIYVPRFVSDLPIDGQARRLGERPAATGPDLEQFTPRQQDVLRHLVKGMSNKEIARALRVSESTVKFQIASLCSRLGVKNRTEVAVQVSAALSAAGADDAPAPWEAGA